MHSVGITRSQDSVSWVRLSLGLRTTQNIVISVQLNKYRPQGNLIKGGDQALDEVAVKLLILVKELQMTNRTMSRL